MRAHFRELKARIERITRACDRGLDRADLEEVAGRAFSKLESLRQRGFSGNNRAFRTHLVTPLVFSRLEVVVGREGTRWYSDME